MRETYEERVARLNRRMVPGGFGGRSAQVAPVTRPTPLGETLRPAAVASGPPTISIGPAGGTTPCDFRCSGSGDQSTFLAAWNAVMALADARARLVILPGSYNFSARVTFDGLGTKHVTIWGYGAFIVADAVTYPNTGDFDGMIWVKDVPDAEIAGLNFYGNGRAYDGLEVSACARGLVLHCSAQGTRNAGFESYNGYDLRFVACSVHDADGMGFYVSGTGTQLLGCAARNCTAQGFYFGGSEIQASGCIAFTNGGHGFEVRQSDNGLSSCFAYQNDGSGFWSSGFSTFTSCIAVANVFGLDSADANFRLGGGDAVAGCISRVSRGRGFSVVGAFAALSGCRSEHDYFEGFVIDGADSVLSGVLALDSSFNDSVNPGTAGAYACIRLGANADRCIVTGCRALGSSARPKAGILIDAGATDNFVAANHLKMASGAWGTAPLIDNGTTTQLTMPGHATYGDNLT